MSTATLVIVEDNPAINEFLEDILRENNYTVFSEKSGTSGLKLIEKVHPELVVLDLNLPDINGETVCKRIKEFNPEISVIILTADATTQKMVDSFEKGADDYINKPFKNEELLSRIKARLRGSGAGFSKLTIDDLELDIKRFEVRRGTNKIELTKTEFKLLEYLMINANVVLSRMQILGGVWSQEPDIETRVVDVYVGYLRKKIDTKGSKKLIFSKRGFGYVLKGKLKKA